MILPWSGSETQGSLPRLGPGTPHCRAAKLAPGHSSPPATNIQRNYMGLKTTLCMHSWGERWTKKMQKRHTHTQTTVVAEEPGAKNWVLGAKAPYWASPPNTQHHKGMGKPPKLPLTPNPQTPPDPHPRAHAHLSEPAREPVLCYSSVLYLVQDPQ